jgi:hypothetical protein
MKTTSDGSTDPSRPRQRRAVSPHRLRDLFEPPVTVPDAEVDDRHRPDDRGERVEDARQLAAILGVEQVGETDEPDERRRRAA